MDPYSLPRTFVCHLNDRMEIIQGGGIVLITTLYLLTISLQFHRWGLVISDLRLEDSGKYECQVNSNPEMKQEVELLVRDQQQSDMPFEPAGRTIIEGPREEVVKIGSVVVFACSARHQFSKSDQPPVVWLKDGNPIDKFEVRTTVDWIFNCYPFLKFALCQLANVTDGTRRSECDDRLAVHICYQQIDLNHGQFQR